MKVRITQRNWQGFTGNFGTAEFIDGEADISMSEAMRLGAQVEIRLVNADGTAGEIISPSNEMLLTERLSAPLMPHRQRGTDEVAKDPTPDAEVETETVDEDTKVWTAAELEAVADADGIAGLRNIATPIGIKGTSISGLIESIVEFQSQNK